MSKFNKIKDNKEELTFIQEALSAVGVSKTKQEALWNYIDKKHREDKRDSESIRINIEQAPTKNIYEH